MERLKALILDDIEWRVGEIALIKAISADPGFSPSKKDVSVKYSIPALYALWEGFIEAAFSEYIRFINEQRLSFDKVNIDMLTHEAFSSLHLHNTIQKYEKQKAQIKSIYDYIFSYFKISSAVPTKSNVDYDRLVEICHRYCVDMVPEKKYRSSLNKFVNFRNKVAHGNQSIVVNPSNLEEFSELIINLMYDIAQNIFSSIETYSFSNNPIE